MGGLSLFFRMLSFKVPSVIVATLWIFLFIPRWIILLLVPMNPKEESWAYKIKEFVGFDI